MLRRPTRPRPAIQLIDPEPWALRKVESWPRFDPSSFSLIYLPLNRVLDTVKSGSSGWVATIGLFTGKGDGESAGVTVFEARGGFCHEALARELRSSGAETPALGDELGRLTSVCRAVLELGLVLLLFPPIVNSITYQCLE